MTTEQICIMISIIAYLGIVIAVGLRFSKKNKSADDFYLGGRKLGPLVTAMSAEASDMSSWLLMGLPGVAYFFGIAEAFWTALGLAIGSAGSSHGCIDNFLMSGSFPGRLLIFFIPTGTGIHGVTGAGAITCHGTIAPMAIGIYTGIMDES